MRAPTRVAARSPSGLERTEEQPAWVWRFAENRLKTNRKTVQLLEKPCKFRIVLNMADLFFSTGGAARALGVTPDAIRRLCDSGAVEAQRTPGGQLRLPTATVERLRIEGLPPIGRPLPGDRGAALQNRAEELGHLLHTDSEAVKEAAEKVAILRHEVEEIDLRRQKETGQDWFRDRERKHALEREAEEAERQAREAEEAAERRREAWFANWETRGLDLVPSDAPAEVKLEAHEAVRKVLQSQDRIPADNVTLALVTAAVDTVTAGWQRDCQIEKILIEVRDRMLPYEARRRFTWENLTDYQIRAMRAAGALIIELTKARGEDVPLEEIRTVATQAAQAIGREFREQQIRDRVSRDWQLRGLTHEEEKLAKTAVSEAIAQLPSGRDESEIKATRDAALLPFLQTVAQRQTAERDRTARAWVEYLTSFEMIGWPTKEKENATAAVVKALAELPPGTAQARLREVSDRTLQVFRDAHAWQERKLERTEGALREIYPYIGRLEARYDFGSKTARTLEMEIRSSIRDELQRELTGRESPDQATRIVRRLVREALGI